MRLVAANDFKLHFLKKKKLVTQVKDATAKIKELADVRTQSMDDVDSLLRVYHSGIQSGELAVGQKETLDRLLREHRAKGVSAAA